MNLVELRRIAEAATPGEWGGSAYSRATTADFEDYAPISAPNWHALAQVVVVVDKEPSEEGAANAAFIAAFNPSTALALLDQLERAREAQKKAREALMACREGLAIGASWASRKPDSQNARDKIKHGLDAIRSALAAIQGDQQ